MAAVAVRRTTVRLPVELDARLEDYCAATGAVKNRVLTIALTSFLGDGPAPAVAVQPLDELEDAPAPSTPGREARLLREMVETLDAREVPAE
jgi:predicted DNA-binding protein